MKMKKATALWFVMGVVLGWALMELLLVTCGGCGEAHAAAPQNVKWAKLNSAMKVELGYRDDGVVVWRQGW